MRLVNESLMKDKWEQAVRMFWNRMFIEISVSFVILDLINLFLVIAMRSIFV